MIPQIKKSVAKNMDWHTRLEIAVITQNPAVRKIQERVVKPT